MALAAWTAYLTVATGAAARSEPGAPTAIIAPTLLPYATPGTRVDIGGRRINFQCAGEGGPTVILMAGLSSWSAVWYKVQPEVAKQARVCAFDRASYGFSAPAPRPQLLSDTVKDLRAALRAADLPGPYVLVGHSLGGVEARLFAKWWPQEVAGMVLVDTNPADLFLVWMRQPHFDMSDEWTPGVIQSLQCGLLASKGPLTLHSAEYRQCTPPLPPNTPEAFERAMPSFFTPDYFAAQVSLLQSLLSPAYNDIDHLDLGSKPLSVLSAGLLPRTPFWDSFQRYWYSEHEAFAHMSTRGVHRIVDGAAHEIQLDRPDAVIDAIGSVVADVKMTHLNKAR